MLGLKHSKFFFLALFLNCAFNVNAGSDDILHSLDNYHNAGRSENLGLMLSSFSEEYTNRFGAKKSNLRPFFESEIENAVYYNQLINMSLSKVVVEDDIAAVAPVIYTSWRGNSVLSYNLKKERDGIWRIINTDYISSTDEIDKAVATSDTLHPNHLKQSRSGVIRDNSKRVLFLGNSYTDYIIRSLMKMMLESAYKQSIFEFKSAGGYTLQQYAEDEDVIRRIKSGDWDYVVLQGHSRRPVLKETAQSFQQSIDVLSKIIRESGAEPILYMTWGRRDGDLSNREILPNYNVMQSLLSTAYRSAAVRNSVLLAPVGDVWSKVRRKDEMLGDDLYSNDGSHPSVKGAYLVSTVLYQVIFGELNKESQPLGKLTDVERKTIVDAVSNIK